MEESSKRRLVEEAIRREMPQPKLLQWLREKVHDNNHCAKT